MNGPRTGRIRTVAILGAGPAASTLGVLLARRGLRVVLFHRPKRAPLLVGESLVPAIIPMLRLLGVEEQVRHFSMLKPGATFNISASVNFSFPFEQLRGSMPRYAYNVPRDRFDDTLLDEIITQFPQTPASIRQTQFIRRNFSKFNNLCYSLIRYSHRHPN